MKKNILYAVIAMSIITIACKKNNTDSPGNTDIVYKKLDSVLGYERHSRLKIDNDTTTDIILNSVLMMQDNKPYLFLYARSSSQSGNKILVKQDSSLPPGGNWAQPLQAGDIIGPDVQNSNIWTSPSDRAIFAGIMDDGDTVIYSGLWIGLQRRYLAIQLNINNKMHFGWICVSHEAGKQELQIHELAYNNVPEQAIKAGQR